MSQPGSDDLIQRVARRMDVDALAARTHLLTLVAAGLYALLLLASRLLALIPNVFDWTTLLLVPGVAVALALLFRRRTSPAAAARAVDVGAGTKDLFLTATLLETAPGAFRPVVKQQAEARAAGVAPAKVVPFRWGKYVQNGAAALAVLLVGVLFLPQLDPFGKEKARRLLARRKKVLQVTRKATKDRADRLRRKTEDLKKTDEVTKAIDDLLQTFRLVKPDRKKQNADRLAERQKKLGGLWQRRKEEQFQNAFTKPPSSQRFGGADMQKMRRIQGEIAKGDMSGVQKELMELKRMARKLERLSAEKQTAEAGKTREDMKRRLKNLKAAVASRAKSKPADTAFQRALEQLQMTKTKGLSKEAMQALKDSLDLAGLETEDLQKQLQDMRNLEDAMRCLQAARKLNAAGKLGRQGKGQGGGMKTLEDYEKLYQELMGQGGLAGKGGDGGGPGMGGPGQGRGGKAPEDEAAKTGFKSEKSESILQAGKILMQMKSRGLSKAGTVRKDFRDNMEKVKQDVSEALVREQVPPGYHKAVRDYFDNVEKAVEPAVPGETR
jgi:hypothetical protein